MPTEAADDWVSAPCALCGTEAQAGPHGALWQVKCAGGRHRTRFYSDRRSAVGAWNVNQKHKRTQGKPHG